MRFVNYYQIFIKIFFEVIVLLTCLICKNKIEWNKEVKILIKALNPFFIIVINLYCINFFNAFFIKKNASNFALDIIFSQIGADH